MPKRLLSLAAVTALAVGAPAAVFAGCATSTGSSSFSGNGNGSNVGGGGNSNNALGNQSGNNFSATNGSSGSGRSMRCDDAGHCSCFNVASLGSGGHTGKDFGQSGSPLPNDSTSAFIAYMNSQSSAALAQVGCGMDVGCPSPAKPTITADFLAQYDVIILQWMVGSETVVNDSTGKPVGFQGNGYWQFSSDELNAFKTWVNNGGGIISLSGYDYGAGELGPVNQILGAVTSGIQYTATDTFGTPETGNGYYCLGKTNMVTGWAPAPDLLGENITAVGAFHGRAITKGPKSVVDCQDGTWGVCAAHEDVGMGHVYAYTDEWVTYTSQWAPTVQPFPDPNVCGSCYCLTDASASLFSSASCQPSGPTCPAVQVMYQVPQFWYNAISYASQATMCPFMLTGTIPR